nr:MAG: RNA-dependent RNA polymerase [Wufeng shrew phenuivirus 5]
MPAGAGVDFDHVEGVFSTIRQTVEHAGLQNLNSAALNCYSAPAHEYTVSSFLPMPDFEVHMGSDKQLTLTVLADGDDDASSMGKVINKSFIIDTNDIGRLNHDLVFCHWPNTDSPLMSIFPELANTCSEITQTPDCILQGSSGYSIIEFGTTHRQPAKSWKEKVGKYETSIKKLQQMLLDRYGEIDEACSVDVIMVSKTKVVTGVALGPDAQTIVDIWCSLMKLADAVIAHIGAVFGIYPKNSFTKEMNELCKTMILFNHRITEFLPPKSDVRPLFMHKEWHSEATSWTRPGSDEIEERRLTNMSSYYRDCLLQEAQECNKSSKDVEEMHAKETEKWKVDSSNYWKDVDAESESRGQKISTKSVVPLPFVIPQSDIHDHHRKPECKLSFVGNSQAPEGLSSLWNRAINFYKDVPEPSKDSDLCWNTALLLQSDAKKPKRENRGRAYRFSIDYSTATNNYLIERGVGLAKLQYENRALYHRIKKESSQVINRNSSTEDIESWLKLDCYKQLMAPMCRTANSAAVESLIELSMEVHGQSLTMSAPLFQEIANTAGFCLSEFFTEIAQELVFSRKHQGGKFNWMIRKLPNYDCWIISHYNNNEHVTHFSLAIPKDSVVYIQKTTVFRSLIEHGGCLITEVISASDSKLKNWFTSNHSYLSACARWMDFEGKGYPVNPETPICIDERVIQNTALCFLISMEDKVLTEEAFTSIRYTCMDKATLASVRVNPTKMIEKCPGFFRTRLQLWAVKKHIQYMEPRTWKRSELKGESNALSQQVSWTGVLHPYLDYEIRDYRQVVDLYYLGYAKNKDEASQANSELCLTAKMLKEEVSFRQTDDTWVAYQGAVKREDHVKHEYSMEAICFSADMVRLKFRRENGRFWEQAIQSDILHEMVKISWEDLSTLKATSNFEGSVQEPKFNPKQGRVEKYSYHRSKMVEKMVQLPVSTNTIKPYLALESILTELTQHGELHVDIFRKLQHGGVREIFVLDHRVRVLQKFVELIARVVCSQFPGEALANPLCKGTAPVEHAVKSHAMKRTGDSLFNLNSSNDAKTWSQNMDVGKLGAFMLGVTPRLFHGFIVRVLKLWENKVIRPPDAILNLAQKYNDKRSELSLDNKLNMSLIRGLWGEEDNTFTDPQRKVIKISSGFMQGILHFTSSAFHAGALHSRDSLFKFFWSRAGLDSCRLLTHDLVSSDDSARMVTSSIPNNLASHMQRVATVLMVSDQMLAERFFRAFGIVMSPKSTYCTPGLVEFNSVYHYGPSVIKPMIKWVFSGFSIVESESLFSRQEVMYNLLAQLTEAGMSFSNVHIIQIAQALLHYRLHGLFTGYHIGEVVDLLTKNPSPMLGFFLMDNYLCPGLLGLRYTHYLHVCAFDVLSRSYAGILNTTDVVSTPEGSIVQPFFLRFADKTKWQHIIENLEKIQGGWKEIIAADPSILYTRPTTTDDCVTKIIVKMCNPSVARSLDSGKGVTRMAASAVYILQNPCITTRPKWWASLSPELEEKFTKRPLVAILEQDYELALTKPPLTPDQMRFIFPQADEFEKMKLSLQDFPEQLTLRSNSEDKKIRISIPIFGVNMRKIINLEDLVKWRWFGERIPFSSTLKDQMWEQASLLLSWLKDTADETLKASPFKDHIQLRAFLSRDSSVSRTVVMYGVSGHHKVAEHPVTALICRHFRFGYDIILPETVTKKGDDVKRHLCMMRLQNLVNSPFTNEKTTELVTELLCNLKVEPLDWQILRGTPHYSIQCLEVMKKVALSIKGLNNDYKMINFYHDLRELKLGVTGHFIREGKRIGKEYEGESMWRGTIGKAEVLLHFQDSNLIGVQTDSISKLSNEEVSLSQLLHDLKVSKCIDGDSTIQRKVTSNGFFFKISPQCESGAPIEEVPTLMSFHDQTVFLSIRNLFLTANSGKVSICMDSDTLSPDGRGIVRILTMKPLPLINTFGEDLSAENPTGFNPAPDRWVNGMPLTAEAGIRIITSSGLVDPGATSCKGLDLAKVRKLARTGLRAKLRRFEKAEIAATEIAAEVVRQYNADEVGDIMQRIIAGGMGNLRDFGLDRPLEEEIMERAGIERDEVNVVPTLNEAYSAMLQNLLFEKQDAVKFEEYRHPWLSNALECEIQRWGPQLCSQITEGVIPASRSELRDYLKDYYGLEVELEEEDDLNALPEPADLDDLL